MNRRRFLALSAAFACSPALAYADTWSGRALGAEVSVTLSGPRELVRRALAQVPDALEEIEQAFSLYRPTSDLSRLNSTGELNAPNPQMRALMAHADTAHRITGGLFDPTVQPLWRALATGGDVIQARTALGWERVRVSKTRIALQDGQALTFNGIAQGFATDVIRARLRAQGATRALVNIGEQAALGGPFTLGIADPEQGHIGTRTLRDMAIATSSPSVLMLGEAAHILGPREETPLWSTVSIEAPTATMADALSTAAVFMDRETLARLKITAGLHRITLVDTDGNVQTV